MRPLLITLLLLATSPALAAGSRSWIPAPLPCPTEDTTCKVAETGVRALSPTGLDETVFESFLDTNNQFCLGDKVGEKVTLGDIHLEFGGSASLAAHGTMPSLEEHWLTQPGPPQSQACVAGRF